MNLDKHRSIFPYFPVAEVNGFVIGWWYVQQIPEETFHGTYPIGYLQLVQSLMDGEAYHIFSGSLPGADINSPDPIDCEDMSSLSGPYDYIMADPPYTLRDCEEYGCTMPNKRLVLDQCHRLTEYVVWLDLTRPPHDPQKWLQIAQIGVDCGNYLPRICSILQRKHETI